MLRLISIVATLALALAGSTVSVAGQSAVDEEQIRGLATQFERADRHKVRFRNSVWTTERVSVQFVAPDVALVHVEWQTRGDLDFDLKP